jgi:hypothetical protein
MHYEESPPYLTDHFMFLAGPRRPNDCFYHRRRMLPHLMDKLFQHEREERDNVS